MNHSTFRSAALLAGLSLAIPCLAIGQGAAGIAGQVLDRSTGSPIPGAVVTVLGSPLALRCDTAGRFTRANLPRGTYVVQARSLGFAARSWIVDIVDGQTLAMRLELDPAPVGLTSVVVEGEPYRPRGMRGFEDRRQRGRGAYITEADIKERGARQLGDILRNVPGVRQVCRRGICRIRMARDDCPPNFFVDGFPANNSTTLELPLVGVIGVEVYRTTTETPPEFLRGVTTCGTIALWTRTGL